MSRVLVVIILLLVSVNLTQGSGRSPRGPKPKGTDGAYTIHVGGYYHGTGSATVNGDFITITATLIGEHGEQGQLNAANLAISGNYVSGQGTLLGQTVTVYGRLDPTGEDGNGKKLKTARFVSNIATADGHHIRVEGILETDPSAAPATPATPSDGSGGGDGNGGNNGGHGRDRGRGVDDDDDGPCADQIQ